MVVRVQYSAPVLVLLTADRFSFLCVFLFRFRLFLLGAFLSILIRCSRFEFVASVPDSFVHVIRFVLHRLVRFVHSSI